MIKLVTKCWQKAKNLAWGFWLTAEKIHVSPNVRIDGRANIHFGKSVFLGRFAWIQAVSEFNGIRYRPHLYIGDNVKMSVHIGCASTVYIGSGSLIASKVLIIDHHHGKCGPQEMRIPPAQRPLVCKDVYIGNNVFLGDGVVVMPGVRIGDNSIVGANSVVVNDIPDMAVAVGAPARVIKQFG